MAFKNDLSAEYVRSLLDYDPETGEFRFRIRKGGRAKVGKIAGSFDKKKYHRIKIDGHLYLASRIAWLYVTGEWPKALIDHEDRDPSNTRFANLREATYTENARNCRTPRRNTSGYKGVSWHKTRKEWRSYIRVEGKLIHLGAFFSAEEASDAYKAAALEHFGDFANLG